MTELGPHQVSGFRAGVWRVLYTSIQSVLKRDEQAGPEPGTFVLLQPSDMGHNHSFIRKMMMQKSFPGAASCAQI